MDPNDLRKLLDQLISEFFELAEPVDPAIFKRLAKKTRQWEQPFNVPDDPGYTPPKEQGERMIQRFRRSLVEIILDEATEDDASVRTPEVQHHPNPGPSNDLAVTKKAVNVLSTTLTVPGSSIERGP